MREHTPYDEAPDPASPGRFVGERRPTIPPLIGSPFPHGQSRPDAPQPPTPPPVNQPQANAPVARNGSEAEQDTLRTLRGAWPPALARGGTEAAHSVANAIAQNVNGQRDLEAPLRSDSNAPTNVYYLAQYVYQLSVTAATMDDHELGLLLPRSGRIWFNVKLFNDPPNGRALAQRDAWWRVIDASPAVRFLLGWCVAVYRTAQFDRAPREALPGRGRVLYFSQPETTPSAMRLQFWSDIARDVTELFAPAARIWRQMQTFTPMPAGERRWALRLTMAGYNPDETLVYLADQNNCAISLIRRTLLGNPPFTSYDDYQRFTDGLLDDLPRLRMQRVIAMQRAGVTPANQRAPHREQTPQRGAIPNLIRNRWGATMEDPRQDIHFWQLHL